MSATNKHVHLPFDNMTCPHPGCTSGKGKTPQVGTVPGIKRHCGMVHGPEVADKIDWPPIRTADGPMSNLTVTQLLSAAEVRGIKTVDGTSLKSDILVALADIKIKG